MNSFDVFFIKGFTVAILENIFTKWNFRVFWRLIIKKNSFAHRKKGLIIKLLSAEKRKYDHQHYYLNLCKNYVIMIITLTILKYIHIG